MVLDYHSWKPIFEDLICNRGIRKINFAGGEPLLYPEIGDCLRFCKQMGATTSLVTNGSMVDAGFLKQCASSLDWIGLSIDSTDEGTEVMLGRHCGDTHHLENVLRVARQAEEFGIHVKLNITVTRHCLDDDFHEFIRGVNPDRVKFLQVTNVPGVNDVGYQSTAVSDDEFDAVILRHKDVRLRYGFEPVFERSEDIIDSYLMLDCLGRVRVGTSSGYAYVDYGNYWNGGCKVNVDSYIRRGGLYDWEFVEGLI